MLLSIQSVAFTVGSAFVLLYAAKRFIDATSGTIFTLHLRIVVAFLFYLLATQAIYVALTVFFQFLLPTLETHSTSIGFIPKEIAKKLIAGAPPALVAALTLTTLLPNFHRLSGFDKGMRERFIRWGSLSSDARELSLKLRTWRIRQDSPLKVSVKAALVNDGFAVTDISFESGPEPRRQWSRAALLWRGLNDMCKTDGDLKKILDHYGSDWSALQMRYRSVRAIAKHCFLLSSLNNEKDEKLRAAVNECLRQQKNFIAQFHQDLCDFTARVLLQAYPSSTRREKALEIYGFSVHFRAGLSVHRFACLFIILLVFFTVGFVSISEHISGPPQQTFGRIVMLSVLVGTNYCIAVFFAYFSKDFGDGQQPSQERPWAIYVSVAGVGTLFSAALMSILYNTIAAHGDPHIGLSVFMSEKWPWLSIPLCVSIATAYLMDSGSRSDQIEVHRARRRSETVVMAMIGAVSSAGAWYGVTNMSDARIPWEVVVGLSTLASAIVGFLVPTWYRGRPPIALEHDDVNGSALA